jgi:hypothetical protein
MATQQQRQQQSAFMRLESQNGVGAMLRFQITLLAACRGRKLQSSMESLDFHAIAVCVPECERKINFTFQQLHYHQQQRADERASMDGLCACKFPVCDNMQSTIDHRKLNRARREG